MGTDTVVGQHVSISAGTVPDQDLGTVPLLRIGDRCVIGRGTHIVAHESIVIGDDVFTGPYVYITDQNHGYADPDAPIGRQWPSNAPVSVGAGSWLGAGAIILPGTVIGRNVVVGAGVGGPRARPGPLRGGRGAGQDHPLLRGGRRLAADARRPPRPRAARRPGAAGRRGTTR